MGLNQGLYKADNDVSIHTQPGRAADDRGEDDLGDEVVDLADQFVTLVLGQEVPRRRLRSTINFPDLQGLPAFGVNTREHEFVVAGVPQPLGSQHNLRIDRRTFGQRRRADLLSFQVS